MKLCKALARPSTKDGPPSESRVISFWTQSGAKGSSKTSSLTQLDLIHQAWPTWLKPLLITTYAAETMSSGRYFILPHMRAWLDGKIFAAGLHSSYAMQMMSDGNNSCFQIHFERSQHWNGDIP